MYIILTDIFLHCKDKEYAAYSNSIVRRRGGVHPLLLLSSSQLSARHPPCPHAYDGGQGVGHLLHHMRRRGGVGRLLHHTRRRGGVGRLLHCKEERRSTLPTPSCASSPPCNKAPSSSILRVGYIFHCKDEKNAAYISPL